MKPDNSEENCNIFVKGFDESMTEEMLEKFFRSYGPVKSCKIAKDSETGKSKCYGFVWFEEGKYANAAMLDFKSGGIPFKIDWYKILAKRSLET
jgi:RNA recognition motif-containing protein